MLGMQAKYPPVAIEIGEGYASAVRLQRGRRRPSMVEWQRVDFPISPADPDDIGGELFLTDDLRLRLSELVSRMGRMRKLSLVLPDAAVRTFFIEMENPGVSGKELDDMIRFKLSRLAPINLEGAALAYQRLQAHPGGADFLAVLTSRKMISAYEDFFRSRGIYVGLIENASLAVSNLVLPSIASDGDFAIMRVSFHHFSIDLFLGGELRFGRTRRLGPGEALESIQQELRTISLFAQDKLGSEGVRKVYIHGTGLSGNGLMDALAGAGFEAHQLELEEYIDLPPDLRGRADDQGTVLAAAGAAGRSL